MELYRDFAELFAAFAAHDVQFLVVGGYAVAAHGHPRLTKDLDLWIGDSPQNRMRAARALADQALHLLGSDCDLDLVLATSHFASRFLAQRTRDPPSKQGRSRASAQDIALSDRRCHCAITLNSTRRLAARPSGVALSAMGRSGPRPTATKRLPGAPLVTR